MAALTLKRPTKVNDGEGGVEETLGDAVTIYGEVNLHKNETSLRVEIHEDVHIEDLIFIAAEDEAPEARYRVINIMRLPGTRWKLCALKREDRPIEP
jgi:hypothetical protein